MKNKKHSCIISLTSTSSSLLTSDFSLRYRAKMSVQLWSLKEAVKVPETCVESFCQGYSSIKVSVTLTQQKLSQVLPNIVKENISYHLGSCYNGALRFIESAGVVFNVTHLPH